MSVYIYIIFISIYIYMVYAYICYIHMKMKREQFVLDNFARGSHHWDMPAVADRKRTHICRHERHRIPVSLP